jgi:epoxyqueuosine reductase
MNLNNPLIGIILMKLNNEILNFIQKLFNESNLNRLPEKFGGGKIFSYPLIGIASGNDYIFQKFKEVVGAEHYTPLEMWNNNNKPPVSMKKLRVISIVFPFTNEIREASLDPIMYHGYKLPAEVYSVARNYANSFKKFVMEECIKYLENLGFQATTGMLSKYFTIIAKERFYSTWSERHIAFAAGIGTFSLHEALITEAGCNVRLASIITDAPLTINNRKSDDPFSNCLFYSNGTCKECINKCPALAISKDGHDKMKCNEYRLKVARRMIPRLEGILKPYSRRINWKDREDNFPVGCGFCQFGVPCMDKNPTRK